MVGAARGLGARSPATPAASARTRRADLLGDGARYPRADRAACWSAARIVGNRVVCYWHRGLPVVGRRDARRKDFATGRGRDGAPERGRRRGVLLVAHG